MSLYSRDLTVLLPRALSDAEQGNYRLLVALSALAQEQSNDMNIAEAMHFSVVCNEDFVAAKNPAEAAASNDVFFGKNFVADMAPICEFWPKASLPSDYFQPIVSAIPSLLLSGGRDPVTPVAWSNNVAQSLANATQLSARGGNHVVSTEGCLPQVIAQFIEQASMNNINTQCVDKIKPLPLVLGANQKKLKARKAKVTQSNTKSVSTTSSSVSNSSISRSALGSQPL
jgi:pimeloyl-ACP methyl ester carboxylesterase